jgi:hypothetical protein
MNKTLFNNHQLINNSDQYFYEKRYLSVNSEDRDYIRFPNSNEFEILLPQVYLNVVSAKLSSWAFPANYNVFSPLNNYNIIMIFKFTELYNPEEKGIINPLFQGIYDALYNSIDDNYIVTIETGFYNPLQMAVELTNRFNEAVTNKINIFFDNNPEKYAIAKSLFQGYDRFKIVYNEVSMKLWFGNTADRFVLKNKDVQVLSSTLNQTNCQKNKTLPEYDNWGLPAYLGLSRCDTPSFNVEEYYELNPNIGVNNNLPVPRFYYGDAVPGSGDNGFWLLQGAPDATVYFVEAPYKISFMGPDHIYMEVDGMNCIDETSPWNISEYTIHNNQTNGIVNSAFAKIPIQSAPLTQFFDQDAVSYKYWNPAAERISKLKFRFRFHNGQLVQFGQFNFTFVIEFSLLRPQQERMYSVTNSNSLSQLQRYSSKYYDANEDSTVESMNK